MFLGICRTQTVPQCVKIVFFAKFWVIKNEVFEKKIAFFVFSFLCWRNRNKKKKKMKMVKTKNPIKIGFFKVVIQKCEKLKKWIFSKNCLTLFVSGREKKNAHLRAHYLFWPKFFFGPKQCKAGNTIKIGVSAEIVKKNKNDTFFWKRVFFDMVEKVGFTNCVFEKLCFPENTIFIVFSAKHSFSKTKMYVEKKQKIHAK